MPLLPLREMTMLMALSFPALSILSTDALWSLRRIVTSFPFLAAMVTYWLLLPFCSALMAFPSSEMTFLFEVLSVFS